MIIILIFAVFLWLSLQSGYAFNSWTNLNFEHSVQLSGIYANSGIVTNNDTIHYSIWYWWSWYENYWWTYRVNIWSWGCLQNYVSGTTNGIRYYWEDDSELDPGSVENCSDIKYFKVNINWNKTIGQYTSTSWNHSTKAEEIYLQWDGWNMETGHINKNWYINIKKHNETSYMDELYVYKNNESIFVTQSSTANRISPLNDNNYWAYEIQWDLGMELYVWENGSSQFVSSGDNWINKFNNNNQWTYRKWQDLYIRNWTESITITTGDRALWADDWYQDETISEWGYANYYDEWWLYIADDTGNSILVHSWNWMWWHARYEGINKYGQGLFSVDSISWWYDLYVWSGNEAIFVNHWTNFWSSKINDNGYATYFTMTATWYNIHLWNWTESILVDEYQYELPSKIEINNYNQFGYIKINPMNNESELKFWDWSSSLLTIDSLDDGISTFDIKKPTNTNKLFYSKNYWSEWALYIRDNWNTTFIGSGNHYAWMNDPNESWHAIYKIGQDDYDTIFLWNWTESIIIDTGYGFWGFSTTQLSGKGTYNKWYTTYRYDIEWFMKKIELNKQNNGETRDKIFINQTNFWENEYSYTIIGKWEISNLSKYWSVLWSGFTVNSSWYIDISSLNYTWDTIYILPVWNWWALGIDTIEMEWSYRPYNMTYFEFDIIMDSNISNSELENFTITWNYTTELNTTVNNGEINYSHTIYHEE